MAYKINVGWIVRDVNAVIEYLTGRGLVDGSRFAIRRMVRGIDEVTFEGAREVSVAIRDVPYVDIYHSLLEQGAYNLRMLDGGLLQMGYYFKGQQVLKHRLAFFPSPELSAFQDQIGAYLRDDLYLGSAARNIVPIPVRFDFNTHQVAGKGHHPDSHLSLGQFEHCRIPVSAPVPPLVFTDFVLRNFYDIAVADGLPKNRIFFDQTITRLDTEMVHLMLPSKK